MNNKHSGAKENIKILVVEDNEMFRRIAMEILTRYESSSAKNIAEARKLIKKIKPDIIFLDIGLPDGNGIDLIKEIKESTPESFIVMLTSSNLKKDVKESKNQGADIYIIKPFSRQKIKDCIDAYKKAQNK